ncbi:MAG: FAD-dependent oxidoreductase, partial [Alphaproteobacteria bacterium]|nr:FAD-dependent oxidoreductase [Alphaproteobacteria bacterium]
MVGREGRERVLVIGAGIVGICTALALQREGFAVTVADERGVGEGASKGNAGIMATSAVMPVGTPAKVRRVPRMLADPAAPLTIRWHYLPRLLPWL